MEKSSVHSVNVCPCDWLNEQADWPPKWLPDEDKVRQERQTENDGIKKGRVRGVTSRMENGLDTQKGPRASGQHII